MTFPPTASAEKLRRGASLPCPIPIRRVRSLFSFHPKPFGTWFLTSLHDGQWYTLCASVTPSSLQPRHSFASDSLASHILFCSHPLPRPDFSSHCGACLSTTFVFLPKKDWIGSTSFNSSHSCLASSISSKRPSCLVSEASSSHLLADHPHVHRHVLLNKKYSETESFAPAAASI